MPSRTPSRDCKLGLVRQQLADRTKRPAQVCREHNLSERVLSRWRLEYTARGEAARGEAALTPREVSAATAPTSQETKIAGSERFCGQLTVENAVSKSLTEQAGHHADCLGEQLTMIATAGAAFPGASLR